MSPTLPPTPGWRVSAHSALTSTLALVFACHRGYAEYSRFSQRELMSPVPGSRLDALAPDLGSDSRLETYVDRIPGEALAEYCRLLGLVDADAPHGSEHVEPTVYEPATMARLTEQALAEGRRFVTTVAWRGDRMVALTEIAVPRDPAEEARQTATVVDRGCRGQRLGWAVKVRNLRRWQEDPDLVRPALATGNADGNAAMLAINAALGFRVAARRIHLVKVRDATAM